MILSRRMAALRAEASKPPAPPVPVEATVPEPDAPPVPAPPAGASGATPDDRPPRRPTHRR